MTPTDATSPATPSNRLHPIRSVDVLPAPAASPAVLRPSRRPAVALLAAVALGVFVRFTAFAIERPLWIDKAMIALNLTDRSISQLFEPLDRNQTAPSPSFSPVSCA
ncbi:MAG: hypothetical protein MUF18_17895 [Fimbriiglobus sp.]|jgi:hypothetical protein|nr:hypothetical protein [Fimbriiglobus sp.]